MKKYAFVLGICLLAGAIQAQCPLILNCSNQPTQSCDQSTNDTGLWNDPGFLDPVHNQHDLCEGGIDLSVKAIDACGFMGVTFSYILLLDLDNNGTLESAVAGDTTYNPGVVPFGNAGNPGYSAGNLKDFDQRAVPAADNYQFALQQTQSGDTLKATLRFSTQQNPGVFEQAQLPLGTHKILWLLRNGGFTDTCAQVFTIKDCKKPVVQCLPSLSVIMGPYMNFLLYASDFLQYMEDNCTPSNQLEIAVEKKNQSSGAFPLNTLGLPLSMVLFDCTELGVQTVRLWARDKAGNADYCEVPITLLDNSFNCGSPAELSICLETENGTKVGGAYLDIDGTPPGVPPISLFLPPISDGCFHNLNSLPLNTGVCLTPTKNDNYINGVSTFDLVLISKHLLGLEPFWDPYIIIAADANKSGTISTFDIVALRKLILGVYTELPGISSWRMVRKNFVFPNPSNPFQSTFPENYCFSSNLLNTSIKFIAVKIGDVNGNAVANIAAPDPPSGEMIQLNIPDLEVSGGETIDIPLAFADALALDGWQWRLGWDDSALELIGATPGKMTTLENFNFSNNSFSGSWSDGLPTTFLPGTPMITLRMRAHKSLRLRDALYLDDRLSAEAYTDDNQIHPLSLRAVVSATNAPLNGLKIYPVQPNPTTAGATLPLQLDRPLSGIFRLLDLSGRVCFERVLDLEPGEHLLEIPAAAMGQSGVYFWQIVAEEQQASGKILKQ